MDIPGTIDNIHAYLSGQLTVEQVETFEHWQNASKQNANLVENVKAAWESALLYESPQFESTSAMDKMPFRKIDAPIVGSKLKSRVRQISRWVAAAVVLLAVGTWTVYQLNEAPIREIDGSFAQYISLDDGTSVFLDKKGKLIFPETFSDKVRLVQLDGEAYFDVAKETGRKFVVETDFATITVLGTEFDVIEDDDAQTVEVFVTEGKVRVQPDGSSVFLDVEVGESALYEHKTGKLQRTKQADMNHLAWHTRRLQFTKAPIPKVIRDIEATYDVTIDYEKTDIGSCTFSSRYENVEVQKILQDMSVVFGFRIFTTQEGHYVLTGGNCNPGN